MDILAIDYSKKDLDSLVQMLSKIRTEAKIEGVHSFEDALKLTDEKLFDLVFIEPDHEDALKTTEFARALKEKNKDIHIIFTSKTKKYMTDAFSVHADAYLVKPIRMEEVISEIDYMMNHYPTPLRPQELIVRTFGTFNVYYRGKKLTFKRNKAKELLAILVDNRGIGLSTREICAMLFHGRKYNEITLGYYHVVLTSLNATLRDAGVTNLIRKSVNYIAINPDMIDCDMYRYLRGEADAVKDYHGDYMTNYSWSEYVKRPFKDNNDDDDDDEGEVNNG